MANPRRIQSVARAPPGLLQPATPAPVGLDLWPPGLLTGRMYIFLSRRSQNLAVWLAATTLLAMPGAALDPVRAPSQYGLRAWTVDDGLPRAPILAIDESPEGYLWIGGRGGIHRFDGQTWRALAAKLAPATVRSPEAPLGNSREILLEDRNGNAWIDTASGLWRRDPAGELLAVPLPLPPPGAVSALFEDSLGNLWVGGEGTLVRLTDGAVVAWTTAEGLSTNAVRSVFEDRAGTVWIGTDGGGLARLRDRQLERVETVPPLPSDVILSVLEQPVGTLWIGTAGGGLCRLAGGRLESIDLGAGSSGAPITALAAGSGGSLWVGTTGGGVFELRDGAVVRHLSTQEGLPNDLVRSLLEDRQGRLWIGTEGGLGLFAGGELRLFNTTDGLANDLVLSLLEDPAGRLWVGTFGGLSLVSDGGFSTWKQADGLANESLCKLLADDRGRLWLSSNKGLFTLSINELEEVAAGRRRAVASDPIDGPRGECGGFSQPSAARGSDGRLWFATTRGLLEVDPSLPTELPPPVVLLEELRVDGARIDLPSPVRLPASVREIEVAFTAPALVGAERLRFRHRLKPYDRGFIDTGKRREARYTNLPAGDYTLQVNASNRPGEWGPDFELRLEVAKPLVRTQPFLAMAGLLMLVSGRGLYRLRLRQLVRRNRQLTEKVEASTAVVLDQRRQLDLANSQLARANNSLRQANEELSDLDRENADFLAVAAHDLRGPLVNLKGFAGEMHAVLAVLQDAATAASSCLSPADRQALETALREDAPEALGFIDASTDRMDQLIDALLSLSRLGRQRLRFERLDMDGLLREILRSFQYQISRQNAVVQVEPLPELVADRASMKLIFENLLHNAILYLEPGRTGRVTVEAARKGEETVFFVRDNGRGIAPAQQPKIFKLFGRGVSDVPGEGLGLAFVRTSVERMGGRIWFESVLGEGTTFHVSLPHLAAEDSSHE